MPVRRILIHLFLSLFSIFMLISLVACGGSSGSGGTPNPPVSTTLMQFKLGDADSDRILSFTATLDSLSVVSSSGETSNLLAAPITLELTRTAGKKQLVAQLEVPQGTYSALRYQVSYIQITAWDVTNYTFSDYVGSSTLSGSTSINPSLVVGATPQVVNIDLDLRNSISFDTAGNIYIDPVFTVEAVNIGRGGSEIAEDGNAEDLIGVVQTVSASSFTMSLGSGANTVQVAFDSATQGQSAALLSRDALVEVDAITRANGSLYASRIDFIETGDVALVEGVVVAPASYPPALPPVTDTATILVQKVWAPGQTAVPNVGDALTLTGLNTAAYTLDFDKLDSWGQQYLTFSNSSLWTGQSVLALITPGTGTVTALNVKLVEIPASGLVSGYDPQVYGFTLQVPPDSAYQHLVNFMPQTYVTVWDQAENKTLWYGFPQGGPQNGMEVRVRGLAFWTWQTGYMPGGPTLVPTRIDYVASPANAAAKSPSSHAVRLLRRPALKK